MPTSECNENLEESLENKQMDTSFNIPFPLVAFPAKMQSFINTAKETLNYPIPYTACSMLLVFSLAIGNTRVLKVKDGWTVKPILFLALVGEAGANKSHPITFVMKPIVRINHENLEKYNKDLDDYRRQLRSGAGATMEKPKAQQLIVSDITAESLIDVHRKNPRRLCLYCDELASWVESFNRYHKGADEQMWLSIYSGEPLCVNRKSSDDILSIASPFIDVIGGIQPDVLIDTFSGNRQSNGFLYRILQARSDGNTKLLWNEKNFPPALEQYWEKTVRRALSICDKEFDVFETPSEYHFSADAAFRIRDWQNEQEELLESAGTTAQVEVFRKIQDYALKFALILHTMEEVDKGGKTLSTEINFETTEKAILLADYFCQTANLSIEDIEERKPQKYPKTHGDFILALPQKFDTSEALRIGSQFGISTSTVNRILKKGKGVFFIWEAHGRYEKIP